MKTKKAAERKVYVTIRPAMGGTKEKLETWQFWEISGALQWMGATRETAYDTAKWLQHAQPGDRKRIPPGITMEVSE